MLVLVVHCSRWLRLWMSKGNAKVHQWLLTFDLEPSWDLSSLAQVNLVKQELGERCPQTCRSISLSSRVSDVAKALQRSFPDYAITWEHQDSTSGYSIDMRVEGNHAGQRLGQAQLAKRKTRWSPAALPRPLTLDSLCYHPIAPPQRPAEPATRLCAR